MRVAAVLAVLVALVPGAGCLQPLEQIILVDERFEDGLDAWTVTGEVEIVPTYHPGEHGLRFVEWAELDRAISHYIYDQFQDGNWIEYTTSCGGTPDLWLEPLPDGTQRVVVAIPTASDGTPEEFERVFVSVAPLPRSDAGPTILGVLTVVADAGPCVIDNLRLVMPQPDNGL